MSNMLRFFRPLGLCCLAFLLLGCPTLRNAIMLSTQDLDFDIDDLPVSIDVWNGDVGLPLMTISVEPTVNWLIVNPGVVVSAAPVNGVTDRRSVSIQVQRELIGLGTTTGHVVFSGEGLRSKTLTVRATRTEDAIVVSKTSLDFGLDEAPISLAVWNGVADLASITVDIAPTVTWLSVSPRQVTSEAPADGVEDRKPVTVSLDRTELSAGPHIGAITFSGNGLVTKTVDVTVIQQSSGGGSGLTLSDVKQQYSAPYLLDFGFTLLDGDGAVIVAEPAQFNVSAFEGDIDVSALGGVHLKRGAARPLKMELVMDYALGMQTIPDAVAGMETAAKETLLPALNADAQVGITVFHASDELPVRVADFTVERDYLADRIDAIRDEIVAGFYSGSRIWDALFQAAELFPGENPSNEARYIVLMSDGKDTSSSLHTLDDAINEAIARGVKVHAIGFGDNVNVTNMLRLTSLTGGEYIPAAEVADIEQSILEIVDSLGGQYNLRWAALARNTPFTPFFTVSMGEDSASYTATTEFVPQDYAGDEREGRLAFDTSNTVMRTTAFLRATYVPRVIDRFRIFLQSDTTFNVSLVGATDGGLMAGWTLTETETDGGTWYEAVSPDAAIPFGTFGPMLRIDFDELIEEGTPLFNTVTVDNSLYASAQTFVVEGYEPEPPVTKQAGSNGD